MINKYLKNHVHLGLFIQIIVFMSIHSPPIYFKAITDKNDFQGSLLTNQG